MKLSFHGAAQGVTGSCHLLEAGGKRILLDCGMYQGGRNLEQENHGDFGFDPASIDYLLLSHGHLDHCGRIPLLCKRGFRGETVTTSATSALARVVMLDAAHLHEEEARRENRRRQRKATVVAEPLYTVEDAFSALERFGRTVRYDTAFELQAGLRVTFSDAGHILGSACILVEQRGRRLLFSGDLGNSHRPILRDPSAPPHADTVVMETTYGDRLHKSTADSAEELNQALTNTLSRGGTVLIPTFALERAQELLYFIREAKAEGRIPSRTPVYLDSPMAISATDIFRRHPECYDEDSAKLFRSGTDPFAFPGLQMTRSADQSRAIAASREPAIILAGSGMCTGGRIRHHLRHYLWRENTAVIFVGFAAPRTLARRIIDGAKSVHIFGEEIVVRASKYTINGFSAHADRDQLLAWHRHTGSPEHTFLVHGEPDRGMKAMAATLEKRQVTVHVPALGESVGL